MWPHSVLVLDIRGETFNATAGYRSGFTKVFKFAPLQPETHGYNPLDFVRNKPGRRDADIMAIVRSLIPSTGSSDEYWVKDARELVAGVVSYVLESPRVPDKTIASVMDVVFGTTPVIVKLTEILGTEDGDLSPFTKATLLPFLEMSEKQFSGLYGNLRTAMRPYMNEYLRRATAFSSFDMRAFRRERMSLYVDFRLSQTGMMAPLVNLLISQIVDSLSETTMGPGELPVLILLDELSNLGRLEPILSMWKVLAGNGVGSGPPRPADEGLGGSPPRAEVSRNGAPLGPVLMPPKDGRERAPQILEGVLPLGRHASISGSSSAHCVSLTSLPLISGGAKRSQTQPVQAITGLKAGKRFSCPCRQQIGSKHTAVPRQPGAAFRVGLALETRRARTAAAGECSTSSEEAAPPFPAGDNVVAIRTAPLPHAGPPTREAAQRGARAEAFRSQPDEALNVGGNKEAIDGGPNEEALAMIVGAAGGQAITHGALAAGQDSRATHGHSPALDHQHPRALARLCVGAGRISRVGPIAETAPIPAGLVLSTATGSDRPSRKTR